MAAEDFVQAGNVLTLPAPSGGVTKGRIYLIGALACVATQTVAANVVTTFELTGVRNLPKDGSASVSFTAGERVFWDPVNHRVAKTNAAHFPIGCVTADAANAATTVNVRLDGVATALVG